MTNKKPILYVDLDGTCADFYRTLVSINNNVWPENPEIRHRVIRGTCMRFPRIFRDLPLIPGAQQAVNELWDKYDIYFLSAPLWIVPESYTDKRLWVGAYFGEKAAERLILSNHKHLCIGEYLIDDRPDAGAKDFTGEWIHFGSEKFPNWDNVKKYLLK